VIRDKREEREVGGWSERREDATSAKGERRG